MLHLVAMALLEEQQQLENKSDDDVTFNYTCKISRQYTTTQQSNNTHQHIECQSYTHYFYVCLWV